MADNIIKKISALETSALRDKRDVWRYCNEVFTRVKRNQEQIKELKSEIKTLKEVIRADQIAISELGKKRGD